MCVDKRTCARTHTRTHGPLFICRSEMMCLAARIQTAITQRQHHKTRNITSHCGQPITMTCYFLYSSSRVHYFLAKHFNSQHPLLRVSATDCRITPYITTWKEIIWHEQVPRSSHLLLSKYCRNAVHWTCSA